MAGLVVATCYAFATAGFHQPDDHGYWGASRAESIATIAIAIVVPLLLIVSLEVARRCTRRFKARWFICISLWTAVVLYLSAESWHGAANVTSVGAVVAVAIGVITTLCVWVATNDLPESA